MDAQKMNDKYVGANTETINDVEMVAVDVEDLMVLLSEALRMRKIREVQKKLEEGEYDGFDYGQKVFEIVDS